MRLSVDERERKLYGKSKSLGRVCGTIQKLILLDETIGIMLKMSRYLQINSSPGWKGFYDGHAFLYSFPSLVSPWFHSRFWRISLEFSIICLRNKKTKNITSKGRHIWRALTSWVNGIVLFEQILWNLSLIHSLSGILLFSLTFMYLVICWMWNG